MIVWVVVTAVALAANEADVAFAGIKTEAGRLTDPLLLARFTANPVLGAGPLKPTVQASLTAPVRLVFAQTKLLSAAVGAVVEVEGPSCSTKLADVPLIEACRVAVCGEVTAATFTVNVALGVLVVTLTEPGTANAELSLERLTETPPLGAGAFNVAVQESIPELVNDAVVQLRLDIVSAAVAAALPEPLREMVVLP